MTQFCDECGRRFDDAERMVFCPHPLIMSREDLDQKIAALKLQDQGGIVRFNHQPDGPAHRIVGISHNGMLTLEDMAGEFAPHLFRAAQVPSRVRPLSPGDGRTA